MSIQVTESAAALESETGAVTLRGLEKIFGEGAGQVRAVDGVDLDIQPGEFITLLGPSGCGKTTTLRIIAGFEAPSQGQVHLDGEDMLRLTPDKRPMAMVFQTYALFPHMTVFDNVAYGLKLQGLSNKQISDEVSYALVTMGLSKLRDRAPNQLSGGQQQRVALARAMVMKPKVLLFDEPLSNLDAKLRVQMRTEIRRLQERLGITSIYVTHDQDEAMSMSDRIVVMRNGKIEQVARPEEVYRRPQSVFVADFIGRANFLEVQDCHFDPQKDQAEVRVLGQTITVPANSESRHAEECTLLVRPESVRVEKIQDTGSQKKDVIGQASTAFGDTALVLSSVFYGNLVEYDLETEVGNLTVVHSDPDEDQIFTSGTKVRVKIEPNRAWLLPSQ